ncbi:hypothetical protein AGABI1DRAFT_34630 [Agaricus bisporus var. burnettii JB137-S8]|uniref:Protein N-terminal glutamine amidohydrolase n=1 Tax=Agaricus bisporus var. burnettii (strain JB137-S8 / ATCC MYA-4627 / FGSC 10392) TaxID=597362 RepID=K5X576_AGABU|nr:uncharacterized protein AGABI1DRAFT_34630 [Agaricus bisporus var. burnettii JB137-S8]EKM83021.1 hypothetical protein AGABI1DRAFT_34630 [Agaricus bisporus var. burnettii JB137-S8]
MSDRGQQLLPSASADSEHQVANVAADPPGLPADLVYTRCYCEENVYLLCEDFMNRKDVCERWNIWVVFISNETKTVALWDQKVAREPGAPVLWDYHVILVLEPTEAFKAANSDCKNESQTARSWVYDFDTLITPVPCTWLGEPFDWWHCTSPNDKDCDSIDYIARTFPRQENSMFRLIPGSIFINYFASDRSHMLIPDQGREAAIYISPPPEHAPLCGAEARKAGVKNNLMERFVTMDASGEGEVVGLEEAVGRF